MHRIGRDERFKPFFLAAALLPPSRLQAFGVILERAFSSFPIDPNCEITLEANPGTVDYGYFSGYRDAGINRISVGIQSFQPRLLKFLGRVHTVEEGRKALDVVSQSGVR